MIILRTISEHVDDAGDLATSEVRTTDHETMQEAARALIAREESGAFFDSATHVDLNGTPRNADVQTLRAAMLELRASVRHLRTLAETARGALQTARPALEALVSMASDADDADTLAEVNGAIAELDAGLSDG